MLFRSMLSKMRKTTEKIKTFDLSYFLGKMFFGDGGFQNMFVYQPTLYTLELKRTRTLNMFWVGNQKEYVLLNLHNYILCSCIIQSFLDIKQECNSVRVF